MSFLTPSDPTPPQYDPELFQPTLPRGSLLLYMVINICRNGGLIVSQSRDLGFRDWGLTLK